MSKHETKMVNGNEWRCSCGKVFRGDVLKQWTQHGKDNAKKAEKSDE